MNKEELALEVVVEGFRQFMRQMDRMEKKIDDNARAWKDTGGSASKASGILKTAGAGALTAVAGAATLAVGALTAVGGVIAKGVQTAIDYESAFTGVIKTVDGVVDSSGELTETGQQLKDELRGLATEIPIAFEELAGIAELGGQLGVAAGDITSFTDTIAKIGVATNLSSEEAATAFAQIGNVLGSNQDDLNRFGDSVVALGNNMATTERDIVNFAQRIAGAGSIAGLSEADVAGIAAAFSSVGIEAEAGGTAVQKVLLGMNTAVIEGGEKLDTFAKASGLSSQEFAELWEKDAASAFTGFVEGLGEWGDEAIFILEDLGMKDQRLVRSFLSLANAGYVLDESITLSNEAFKEQSALTEEAERRFATTESQIQLLKNTFGEILAVIGEAFLPILNEMIAVFRDFITEHAGKITQFFQDLSTWITETAIPALMQLASWVQENLPSAVDALASKWGERLQPLFEQLSIFISETLLPVLETLWIFFIENIIPVVAQLAEIYLVLMIEMWTQIFTIINENVVPALEQLWVWLGENVLPVVQDFVMWLTDELFPALEKVWAFLEENFTPVFKALFEVVDELIRLGLEILVYWWKDEVLPAMNDVWDFIETKLLPVFRDINDFLFDKLFGTLDEGEEKFSNIEKAMNFVRDAAKSLTEWLGNIVDKLSAISIPDQLKAQSPPKFARGLDFISESAKHLSTVELPRLEARMLSMNQTTPALSTAGTAVTNNFSTENNFNLTTQSVNRPGTLAMEFQSMEMSSR